MTTEKELLATLGLKTLTEKDVRKIEDLLNEEEPTGLLLYLAKRCDARLSAPSRRQVMEAFETRDEEEVLAVCDKVIRRTRDVR